LGKFLSSGIKS
jgi:hypothetical protein